MLPAATGNTGQAAHEAELCSAVSRRMGQQGATRVPMKTGARLQDPCGKLDQHMVHKLKKDCLRIGMKGENVWLSEGVRG